MKKTIKDFIHLFEPKAEHFIDGVFSAPATPDSTCRKVRIRPILLKNEPFLQVNSFSQTQCFTKNHPLCEVASLVSSLLAEYRQAVLRTKDELFYIQIDPEGFVHWKQKKEETPLTTASLEHNRKKQYLIPEKTPIDFLIALDIMDAKGNVFREKFDKFKQVNQFVQYVFEVIDFDKTKEYTIVDFGCGKAVLTFALAFLLRDYKVQIIGIDLKQELLEKCQALAKNLGYTNLTFCSKAIDSWSQEHPVDLVIALHACNTATDDAIKKACALEATALLIAPCCHHEVQRHIQKQALPLILKHPLLKERFSSLLTDALRLEFLAQHGYKADVVEFVDQEHTPKNILIRARKMNTQVPPDWTEYQACLKAFGLS